MKSFAAAAGLFAVAQAFTQPVQPPTYGALNTPNTQDPVITGQTFDITWSPLTPTNGATVSLVLCNGPSSNCVLQSTAIASGIPASQASYAWSVPCNLPLGVQGTTTGYGMLIIVDGTGQFQYSTQFSVEAGSSCGSSSSSSSSSTSSSTSTSSSSSVSTTSSSGSATSSNPGWAPWASSSTTVISTTPQAVSTPSPTYSTWMSQSSTTMTTVPTYSYSSASSSSATISTPQAFTGAAALPTAFVNAAGVMGAAALAVLAL